MSRKPRKIKGVRTRPGIRKAAADATSKGISYFEKGEFVQAAEHLLKALELDPLNVDLMTTLGFSYIQTGQVNEAILAFSEAVMHDSENHFAYQSLARAYYQTGEWAQAEEALLRCVEINPSDNESLNDLGVIAHMRGDFDEAEHYFSTSLSIDFTNIDAQYNAGLIFLESGDYKKALTTFERFVRENPDNKQARKHLVESMLRAGNSEEALREIKIMKETEGADPVILCLLGRAYYGLRDIEQAQAAFRECLEVDPDNVAASESLATTLLRAGKSSEALEIWERLLKLPERMKSKRQMDAPRFTDWEKISPFSILNAPDEAAKSETEGMAPTLSVVIPIYDEAENLPALAEELIAVMDGIGEPYEIIFIDDGSRDDTADVLRQLRSKNRRLKGLMFRRNYGQTAALSAGFEYARGEVVITLDGDRQNDPADIPKMLEKLAEGYDMVSGWRVDRKDTYVTRRLPSVLANKIIGRITGTKLHDYGCALKAYKKGIIKNIHLYGEMHRFIPAVVSWLGASIAEIPVNHRPRVAGNSKYGLSRTIRVILDLINVKFLASYLTRPMQYFGKLGLVFMLLAGIEAVLFLVAKYFFSFQISLTLFFLTGIFFILMGLQFMTIGLIAEIIIRTYHEASDKPIYVLREIID